MRDLFQAWNPRNVVRRFQPSHFEDDHSMVQFGKDMLQMLSLFYRDSHSVARELILFDL